ncbi:beta-galactosidase [Demequina lignilytica]|uniref:Beta-galactosidase n=1 Tax=Demequina lignilytica TaxID=3051663 RepID=A0AB35MER4_9MICO|nr:beta-galactosidase [Demequina sp. SYSU T0a273]MDN4482263.1 beta-galactosidase [Demequina sp. SYSU T0a273]
MTIAARGDEQAAVREAVRVPRPAPLAPAPLDLGDAPGTPGRLEVSTRCLLRDGTPWIPVMGEYHFSRDLPERWERELRKMRAGGVDVVATYLIWILHEEIEGDLRWDAALDVRRFVEIAHRVGLKVILRIGPWVHGETRNGGYPDWLQDLPVAHRTDDPAYLEHVRRWIDAIAEQTQGLFHGPERPDAPVIGVQVENELYDQPGHLATLRRLCEDAGMRASLWTATGWGGAQLPARAVLPVYAGYSDGFWEEYDVEWPAFGAMHFTFNEHRDDLTVGADLRAEAAVVEDDAALGAGDPWPYATCELGGGMTVAYHRRPHVDPEDVAALALTKLGSGSSWQGYYLYHGGTHVIGERSTTQESHATGYPNDVPVLDYDFFAPLGAQGQQRPHFHQLRRQHLFLRSFGASLAPLPAVVPEQRPGGPRWSVRHDGERGYLFLNNHQPAVEALPSLVDVGFTVEGSDRTVTVPVAPIRIPADATAIWPLRQPCGAIPALTATAQLVTRIEVGGRTVVVLAAADGIDVELQLEGVLESDVAGASVERRGDLLLVRPDREPGPDCVVSVGDTDLVVLTGAQADTVWRGDIGGRDTVVLWDGEAWFDDDGFRIVPNHRSDVVLALPALAAPPVGADGPFVRHAVPAAPAAHVVPLPEQPDPTMAPVRADAATSRRSAPTDDDFAGLAPVSIAIDDSWFDGVEQLILSVDWFGDVARLYVGETLVADQFFSGRRLELDLMPHRAAIRAHGLRVKAFAWRPGYGIHLDRRVRTALWRPVLELRSAEARPVVTVAVS